MSYERFIRMPMALAPRPFPGKYPTRISVYSRNGRHRFSYMGKPTPNLLAYVGAKFFRAGGVAEELTITEFDQNGVLLKLNGGNLERHAGFIDAAYFPMPPFYWSHLGRIEHTFVVLDRELSGRVYRNRFWQGTQYEGAYQRMIRDCTRGRLNRPWFAADQVDRLPDFIFTCAERWSHPTQVTPQPQGVPVGEEVGPEPPPEFVEIRPPTAREVRAAMDQMQMTVPGGWLLNAPEPTAQGFQGTGLQAQVQPQAQPQATDWATVFTAPVANPPWVTQDALDVIDQQLEGL